MFGFLFKNTPPRLTVDERNLLDAENDKAQTDILLSIIEFGDGAESLTEKGYCDCTECKVKTVKRKSSGHNQNCECKYCRVLREMPSRYSHGIYTIWQSDY